MTPDSAVESDAPTPGLQFPDDGRGVPVTMCR
jgi:hypothetical protein